jgi:hypothetical protein
MRACRPARVISGVVFEPLWVNAPLLSAVLDRTALFIVGGAVSFGLLQ